MGLVGVAGPAAVGEALELQLEVGEHGRVEQVPQLLGAEELAQQVAIEGQRRGPALGQGCIAAVHVDGDPPEEQGLGERRRLGRVDGHDLDLPSPQVGEHLAQGGQVEHVVEALAGGLEQDREVGVPSGDGEQVGGPLALLPQRGAAVGAAARQQQRPGRALAEAPGEHGRLRELGDHQLVDLRRIDRQLLDREGVDRLGQAHDDAVVAPDELDLDTPPLGQAGLQGHPPGGVDLGAERGVHAHPPVADLVTEALDDDGAVVGHDAVADSACSSR